MATAGGLRAKLAGQAPTLGVAGASGLAGGGWVGVRATTSVGRGVTSFCDAGGGPKKGHREAEDPCPRPLSKPPPLPYLRPLKGAGTFLFRRREGSSSSRLPPRP